MNTVNTSSVLATVLSFVEDIGQDRRLSRPPRALSTSRSSWSVFRQGRLLTHTAQPTLLPCVEKVSSVSVVSAGRFALQGFSPTSLRRRGRRRFHVSDHRLATFTTDLRTKTGNPEVVLADFFDFRLPDAQIVRKLLEGDRAAGSDQAFFPVAPVGWNSELPVLDRGRGRNAPFVRPPRHPPAWRGMNRPVPIASATSSLLRSAKRPPTSVCRTRPRSGTPS